MNMLFSKNVRQSDIIFQSTLNNCVNVNDMCHCDHVCARFIRGNVFILFISIKNSTLEKKQKTSFQLFVRISQLNINVANLRVTRHERLHFRLSDLDLVCTVYAYFVRVFEPGHIDAHVTFKHAIFEVRLEFQPVCRWFQCFLQSTLHRQTVGIVQVYATCFDYVKCVHLLIKSPMIPNDILYKPCTYAKGI